ncbi:MAG: hypothetical protein FWD66_01365 [Paludibacter sp.]|nr:hypothetical protein [Paludibacter sp.]
MRKIKFLLTTVVIIAISCNKSDETGNQDGTIKLQKSTSLETEIQESLYKGKTVYAKYFENNVDNNISLFTKREHPLSARDFSVSNFAVKKGVKTDVEIFVNDILIDSINEMSANKNFIESLSFNPVRSTFMNEFFNHTVKFKIWDMEIRLYIPEIIEITYPKPQPDSYSADYSFDYRIKWNADAKNINGVAIVVEWDGSMFGEDDQYAYIRRVDIVDDNGETVIKEAMFDKIPDFAVVKVSVLRGDIDIVEVADEVSKIYAASEASLHSIIAHERITEK